MEYPWFKLVSSSNKIEQGDIIQKCPIVIPPYNIQNEDEIEADVKLVNSIILSQSCDLENNKVDIVLLCPYYSLYYWKSQLPSGDQNAKAFQKKLKDLKNGIYSGFHLLEQPENDVIEINDKIVVDFRNVYGVEIHTLRNIANQRGERLRLLPPYREHLSQSFARFFMRVGLPQDISI